ncbi:calcium-translocating P-type ATPase, SERCA-type [Fusibacter bizertensis]
MYNVHSEPIEQLKSEFKTDFENGLTVQQIEVNRGTYGKNELETKTHRTLFNMLFDQFKDFTVIILMIAAVLSMILKEWVDGIVIIGIVVLNAGLGTYQENKASNALEALKKMASPKTKVSRDGKIIEVDSQSLVPGDIVHLETGDFVPADIRLLESTNLKIDESALTGESVASEKDAKVSLKQDTGIGDRANSAFSGTIVTYGRGKGVVVNTGMATEIGKIAKMLNETEEESTPLQKKLTQFGKMLGIICLAVSVIIIVLGFVRGGDMLEIFLTAVSLAVAAIPEGLPAVVTTVLALGMQRMVKRNAIMKRLSAVETLGSTTTICSDKTGTLTQNKMTVQSFFINETLYEVTGTGYTFDGEIKRDQSSESEKEVVSDLPLEATWLFRTAALCNDAEIEGEDCIGDPTEGALVVLAQKSGIDYKKLRGEYPRIDEYPFDSERKLMSTVHEIENEKVMLTKGATDELISRCDTVMMAGEIKPLTDALKEVILNQNKTYAQNALRVIGYAKKKLGVDESPVDAEKHMTFIGMSGMIDPPREEAIKAIKICKNAGIKVVMITGDHIVTATAIAKQMGIISQNDEAIEGAAINGIEASELAEILKHKRVFARVSPEHKVNIVKALKAGGEVVAMTGDGVNDAPALKSADIGVAMGITGTDVSKEAADMILTDDNFASIVSAVEEGRIIYSNIRKFVGFLLSCNVGEILIIFIAMVANWGVPLVPIQLLWVNLITDSLPAFSLGMEKGEKSIMDQPPRKREEPIVDKKMGIAIIFQSIGLTLAVLASYRIGYMMAGANNEIITARTFAFATLIFGEMLRAYSARRENQFIWHYNIFTNKFLNLSVIVAVALLLIVVYVPPLQGVFSTIALAPIQLLTVIGFSILPVLFGEIAKAINHR